MFTLVSAHRRWTFAISLYYIIGSHLQSSTEDATKIRSYHTNWLSSTVLYSFCSIHPKYTQILQCCLLILDWPNSGYMSSLSNWLAQVFFGLTCLARPILHLLKTVALSSPSLTWVRGRPSSSSSSSLLSLASSSLGGKGKGSSHK